MSQIIEILLYKLKPGAGDAFFAVMQDVSVPLHRRHGIDVVWHGRSMHDADGYGLIRAFADMATLQSSQEAFYASDAWRQGPREIIVGLIDTATKIVVPMNDAAIEGLRREGYHQGSEV